MESSLTIVPWQIQDDHRYVLLVLEDKPTLGFTQELPSSLLKIALTGLVCWAAG